MTFVSDDNDIENVCTKEANQRDEIENIPIKLLPGSCEDGPKKRRRFPYRPYASPTNRIVSKCGKYNVLSLNIPEKRTRYMKDLGNTLLTIRWRWILLSICIANALAYLVYTVLWMLLVMWEESYMSDPDQTPCIIGSTTFTGYFILVVETITTIGTGSIYPVACHSTWVLITLQAITSVAIEGALITTVYIKMSRQHEKKCARIFSRKAVICRRDGVHCLIFRVRDMSGKYWAKTNIKAILIQRRYAGGGESIPNYFHKLHLEKAGLLMWPQEIVHRITEYSPLWPISRIGLCKARFEIMVVLEGDSLTTGEPSQCQTSYTNKEILWGYCFNPCVEYDEIAQKYIVNKKMFNDVVKQEMAERNAQELQSAWYENNSIVEMRR